MLITVAHVHKKTHDRAHNGCLCSYSDFTMTRFDPISPDFCLLVSISPVDPLHGLYVFASGGPSMRRQKVINHRKV